jgi:hypothetical protein
MTFTVSCASAITNGEAIRRGAANAKRKARGTLKAQLKNILWARGLHNLKIVMYIQSGDKSLQNNKMLKTLSSNNIVGA